MNKGDNDHFPMLHGRPSITWKTARVIYRVYTALYSGQSLENIAKRGGFGWDEVELMFNNYEKRYGRGQLNDLTR